MKTVTIIRKGQTIILTDTEVEVAYRAKEKEYAKEDAKNHLKEFFCIDDDVKSDAEAYADFRRTFGFAFEEACDENTEHYMLEDLAERFLENHDCNIADNLQWDGIISRYCSEICREVPA